MKHDFWAANNTSIWLDLNLNWLLYGGATAIALAAGAFVGAT